jgi:hypothetical protein
MKRIFVILLSLQMIASQALAGAMAPVGTSTNNQVIYNNSGALGGFSLSGDCTIVPSTGVITCGKTGGVSFAPSATTDTTNATNISSGTLSVNRFNSGTGATSSTYLNGIGTWTAPTAAAGGASGQLQINDAGAIAGIIGSPIFVTDPTYGAVCDGQTVYDGVITSHGNQLSSASYSFTSADNGKLVTASQPVNVFSGPPIQTPVFTGTILSTSGGVATLSGVQSSGTTTGYKVTWATDDTGKIQAAFTAGATASAITGTTNNVQGSYIRFPDG